MSLATTLMAVGIPAEQANRLGYEDRVPLDGNGTTQVGATEIIATNTNVALGTSAGDTAFILPADAELFQPYFALNTTPDAALVYPPVGDTVDANALNAAVEIEENLARVFQRVEEGRWVSFPAGEGGGGIETIVAGAGINVDATDPDNPVVSNTGVLSVSPGTGIGVGGTAQNPVVSNAGVLSVTAGANVSITGTAQNPTINADAAPVDSVNGQTGVVVLDASDVDAVATIVAGTNITVDATDPQNPIVSASGGGTGTVTAVAVASANGLAGASDGNPATPTLTLSTSVTGILQGNGTAISAASTTGTGAVVLATAPTVSDITLSLLTTATGNITQTQPGGFWENIGSGVNITRLDRVFVGDAAVNDGELPTTVKDWLETIRASTTTNAQFAALSTIGQGAIVGGSRTSDFSTAGSEGSIGGEFWGINDNATQLQTSYAVYAEARRSSGAGTTHGMEIDIVNSGSVVDVNSYGTYSSSDGLTSGLWMASGGGVATASASVAMFVLDNGQKFRKGIVFKSTALDTGNIAIEMASAQVIQWLSPNASVKARIRSDETNAGPTTNFVFADSGIFLQNASNKTLLWVYNDANRVNGLQLVPGDAGSPVVLNAVGDDTNVNLNLGPKGSGVVRVVTAFSRGAPVTKTADFTLGVAENWVLNNKGSACVVTLPAASAANAGREVMFTNIGGAFALTSASANVVPKAGGAATTAILAATDGAWATLVSDGTNWIIMQAGT